MKAFRHFVCGTMGACQILGLSLAAAQDRTVVLERREIDAPAATVDVLDVDGNGLKDVVAIRSEGESFVWYESHAGGEFTKHVVFKDMRFRADRVGFGDIDRDGDLDLVTGLKEGEKRYVVWLENPLPEGKPADFTSWGLHKIGTQRFYVKDIGVADFDGDGKLDVVTRADEETALFFQRDSKGWSQPKLLQHEPHEGMEIADLDQDGDPDIVLNGFWYETPDNAVSGNYRKHVFDKKWFTPVEGTWRDGNAAIKVADLNGDGLLDILISQSELPGHPISVYMVGSAEDVRKDAWRETQIVESFDYCQTLDVGDVDNDGDLDVLAAGFARSPDEPKKSQNKPPYPVVLFYNTDGQGKAWGRRILAEDGMYAGVLRDLGNDGDLDIVGPRSYWTGPIELWESKLCNDPLAAANFTYVQVDASRDRRYFGLAFADLTRDGYVDIVAGKWFYRNPGGDMTAPWQRTAVDEHVDALATIDVDGDNLGDLIALECNAQYWYEATNRHGDAWRKTRIGTLPICDHDLSTQIYATGQIVPGGRPEILLSQYYLEIPAEPEAGDWPAKRYSEEGEGYAIGDVDGDGLLDIAGSYPTEGDGTVPGTSNTTWWSSEMSWWKNPGGGGGAWKRFDIGKATHADRYELGDMNGDGRLDLVTTEERYPGHVFNAGCYLFEQPVDPTKKWLRREVARQKSMNSLDVADMDGDGDLDIVTCEHSMPYRGKPAPGNERLQIWANDGQGNFSQRTLDRGKENHLGAQAVDLDGDGDLDIVGIGWREHQYLHLWRNDAVNGCRRPG